MKDLPLLVWLTQLGLSVAAPLAGFVLLAVWRALCCLRFGSATDGAGAIGSFGRASLWARSWPSTVCGIL